MASSLLNSFGNNNINSFLSRIGEFNNFRNNFKGNPQQEAENLLRTGKMSQEQFNQYAQLANLIRPLIH